MALYAKKQGLQLDLSQQIMLQQLEQKNLAQLAIQDYLARNPVTEDQIVAEYQRVVQELKGMSFKVHHLLYEDEIDAIRSLDEIKGGVRFDQAESAYLEQNNRQNVGDLGWVNLKQVPESFRGPLQQMQQGICLSRSGHQSIRCSCDLSRG